MVAVEQRKAEADKRYFKGFALRQGIALDKLAVGVADHKVRLTGEHQRTEVPQIAVDKHFAVAPVRRGIKHFLHRFLPAFVGVMAQDHRRLAAQLQQEAGEAHHEVRVAIQAKFLAVQPGVGIEHHVNQPAALKGEGVGDRLAAKLADGHQQFIGSGQPQRNRDLGGGLVPHLLHHFFALQQLPRLQKQRIDGVRSLFHLLLRGAAGIHPIMAVGGRVENF